MSHGILAAEFYPGSKTRSPVLDLNRITNGHRSKVFGFNVATKKEARELAKRYGATPWNFR